MVRQTVDAWLRDHCVIMFRLDLESDGVAIVNLLRRVSAALERKGVFVVFHDSKLRALFLLREEGCQPRTHFPQIDAERVLSVVVLIERCTDENFSSDLRVFNGT